MTATLSDGLRDDMVCHFGKFIVLFGELVLLEPFFVDFDEAVK